MGGEKRMGMSSGDVAFRECVSLLLLPFPPQINTPEFSASASGERNESLEGGGVGGGSV